MKRLIFHVDVNNAFLSWEAAERVRRGQADLRKIPSAIGGDEERRHGVILAKSIPAKQMGVVTGEPIVQALRKCPDLYLAKPNFRLYEKNSHDFLAVCRKYAPIVEQYSIDECFLDMSGTERLYPDPVAIALHIKNEIRDTLGFTVNVGIGNNKLLAKMASDFEKPDKVHTLFDGEIRTKLWPMPVRELFSVGRATAERLERVYIRTVGDLACADLSYLQALLGEKQGTQLHCFANGLDDSPVHGKLEDAKGYSNSTTLARDITDADSAKAILLALADSVTSRMRADKAKAFSVSVTVRGADFKDASHQKRLNTATDITDEVFGIACALFDELWNGKTPIRLLGLSLTNLSKDEEGQLSLFETEDRERARQLDRVVDSIRNQFGFDTIKRATVCDTENEIGKKQRAKREQERKT
ncbi:MAG: DNA polymerase IV [Clostridia bacterium]|nr:DNA polymerase IV [Clostridia bacterium]